MFEILRWDFETKGYSDFTRDKPLRNLWMQETLIDVRQYSSAATPTCAEWAEVVYLSYFASLNDFPNQDELIVECQKYGVLG